MMSVVQLQNILGAKALWFPNMGDAFSKPKSYPTEERL